MEKSDVGIIADNDNWLVINKPAGLTVHGNGKDNRETLVDWILEFFPDIKGVGEDLIIFDKDEEIRIIKPGIVHRLDTDTSGVLIVAKNQETFLNFKTKFKNREIEKEYRAIVYGNINSDEGEIDAPIGKNRNDFRQWSAQRGARGVLREAVTDYKVLKRFDFKGDKYTYVAFFPKTGRTHQIRVHAKYLGNPIVSDQLYKGKRENVLGFERQALHAYRIAFNYEGEDFKYIADLPEDFTNLVL